MKYFFIILTLVLFSIGVIGTDHWKTIVFLLASSSDLAFSIVRFYKVHRTESIFIYGTLRLCAKNVILRALLVATRCIASWLAFLLLVNTSPRIGFRADKTAVACVLWVVYSPQWQSALHKEWLHKAQEDDASEESTRMIP